MADQDDTVGKRATQLLKNYVAMPTTATTPSTIEITVKAEEIALMMIKDPDYFCAVLCVMSYLCTHSADIMTALEVRVLRNSIMGYSK